MKIIPFIFGCALGAAIASATVLALPNTERLATSKISRTPNGPTSVTDNVVMTNQLDWQSVEAVSSVQYLDHLRKIACPEQTVYDLMHSYLYRAALKQGEKRIYESVLSDQIKQLGVNPVPAPVDYFFSADQLALVHAGFVQYPLSSTNEEFYALRLNMLGSISPEQTVYYKSEFDHFGDMVDSALTGFRPTQTEYYALITAMNDTLLMPELLLQALGQDRYNAFVAYETPDVGFVFSFCQAFPQMKAKAPQLRALLQQRSQLSEQDYRNKLRRVLDRDMFDQFMSFVAH